MQKSSFFNSINGDRKYNASDYAAYFGSFIGNGVYPNPGNNLAVTASGGMNISVAAGKAWINGYYYENTGTFNMSIDPADGVLKRIDRIVLRLDHLNRQIALSVLKGTPASTPTASLLTRTSDIYELGIADILINNGDTGVNQAHITDLRFNATLCGTVSGVVEQIDTTGLFAQYDSAFNDWFKQAQNTLSGDVAGNILNQINTHKSESIYQLAGGTATAITLTIRETLENGVPINFIASANNSGADTTINGKPLYKPNATIAPTLTAGRAYTVWYNLTSSCFFIKASATGTTTSGKVLAGETYSTEVDTDQVGTITNNGAVTITPSLVEQVIAEGYHNGGGKVEAIKLIAGDILIGDNSNTGSTTSTAYTKVREITTSLLGGTIRVKFNLSSGSSSGSITAYGRIYVNGVAVGIERTVNGLTPITFTEDISIYVGDKIQIYTKSSNSSYGSNVSGFKLYIATVSCSNTL
ncbi:hypothetical protein Cpap_1262 [Ruminiclostridium papyrosolvens DSM 2782]|uniref:Uncharacterized protein n=1 Tax=Ruminiclostridium papyrosolvens DSM 2782 TaxID=588581 RepID=F1TFJ2_9FIRM|nr:hypothetical protein [Ruminiclostridium papyrosolvens]EGD46724.1 hypothetical protein Cpap_1262 [Ruminiclostridium papyrosolvens DSM 2782]WES34932.1 hypothetical protein P0092_02835 [Ruminiclostridium papyrosolvens DSM 2782]